MNGAKRFLRSLGFGALFVLPSGVVLGQGCTIGKEYCDLQCDCTKCSDRAFDDCVDARNRAVEEADAYDCRDEFDAAHECYVDNFSCDEADNVIEGPEGDDCADEDLDLAECIQDASDHDSGSGTTTNATTDTTNTTTNATTSGGTACADFVALCVSCGVGTQQECSDAVAGQTDDACQAGIDQLIASGC